MIASMSIPRLVLFMAMAGVTALSLSACSDDGDASDAVIGGSTVADSTASDAPGQADDADVADAKDSDAMDSDKEDSAGMPDVCSMLSPAEIEAATGFAVGEGAADADRQTERSVLCEWTSTGDRGFVAMAIAPNSFVPYEEGESAAGTAVAVQIPGASESYTLRDGQSVGMSVDGDYIVISLAGATAGNEASAATVIATLVASRY